MIVSESAFAAPEKLHVQLSVIVPVYNQERNVSTALSRIKQVLDSTGLTYEIVAVNDGSKDGTLDVLRREEIMDSRVRIITYSQNMGKGYAVKTGIIQSRGALVMFTDSDLDISPHIISEYITQLQDCDLVIASKVHPQSKVIAPASRKFLSKGFNLCVRILTGIKMKDTQSGLKAGRGELLRNIFQIISINRYAFDVELLTLATIFRWNIKEMPVQINLDRRFKLKDIAKMFADVMIICYRHRLKKQYDNYVKLRTR